MTFQAKIIRKITVSAVRVADPGGIEVYSTEPL